MQNTAFKKISLTFVSLVLILSIASSLVACATPKDDVTVLKESVASQLDQLKNKDGAIWKEIVNSFDNALGSGLEQFGINGSSILEAWLTNFDYTIDSVDISGDQATVNVTLKAPSIMQAVTEWQSEAISSMSTSTITEDFYKDLGNDLIEKLKSADTRDGSVYFVYTKDGNNWDLNEDVTSTSLYNWVLS